MFKALIEAINDALESSQTGGSMEKTRDQGMYANGPMMSPGGKKADLRKADVQRRRAGKKAAAGHDDPDAPEPVRHYRSGPKTDHAQRLGDNYQAFADPAKKASEDAWHSEGSKDSARLHQKAAIKHREARDRARAAAGYHSDKSPSIARNWKRQAEHHHVSAAQHDSKSGGRRPAED